jgi:hypothetical protein
MLRRQKPGEFHNYPEHRSICRRALWRLGFDPLTVYERLEQVRAEAKYWESKAEESALLSIEARNPGIDMDMVRLDRAARRARLRKEQT